MNKSATTLIWPTTIQWDLYLLTGCVAEVALGILTTVPIPLSPNATTLWQLTVMVNTMQFFIYKLIKINTGFGMRSC